MRILISVGYCYSQRTAGMIVGENVAASMSEIGHDCTVIGISKDESLEDSSVKVIKTQPLSDYLKQRILKMDHILEELADKSLLEKILKGACCHPYLFILKTLINKVFYVKLSNKQYKKTVESYVERNDIDALICVVYPFDPAKALICDSQIKCTKVYYQLDPYGTSYILPRKNIEKRKKDEVKTMSMADFVAVSPELYQDYSHDDRYRNVVKKMMIVGFPAFIKPVNPLNKSGICFEENSINILYCGSIDNNTRNPKKSIQVLSELLMIRNDIHIYFMGNIANIDIMEFEKINPERVFIVSQTSPEIASATMLSCDFLLNIGNVIPNMVPSKIFSYFYSQKPILNFEKSEEFPENNYFKKYPLQITIYNRDDTREAAARIEKFICANWNRRASTSIVREEYKKNTSQFVAQQFLVKIHNTVLK